MDGVATIPSVSGGESTYLLSADSYSSSPLASSADTHGYNIFTLSFNSDGSIQPLSCDPKFQYTVEGPSGTINSNLGAYAQATDKAPNKENYVAANDFVSSLIHRRCSYTFADWILALCQLLPDLGLHEVGRTQNDWHQPGQPAQSHFQHDYPSFPISRRGNTFIKLYVTQWTPSFLPGLTGSSHLQTTSGRLWPQSRLAWATPYPRHPYSIT